MVKEHGWLENTPDMRGGDLHRFAQHSWDIASKPSLIPMAMTTSIPIFSVKLC